ncbi:MAG: TadE/TadG family type IV pilus assembly protein [Pseudomonadota bacterium]
MYSVNKSRKALKAFLVRFSEDRCGALMSLEFALVGPAFLGLILALFELGLLMTKTAMLDLSVADATKFIYTGAVQSGTPTQEEIKQFICEKSVVFTNCLENITVELTPISNFDAPPEADAPCVDADDDEAIAPAVDYSTGNGGAIMFMRVCVTTDVVTPGLGVGVHLVDTVTNRMQITSSVAFMNEPF